MMVTFISQCEKNALNKTRRVLDAFANRIGDNTWQTVMLQLMTLLGVGTLADLTNSRSAWINAALEGDYKERDARWSEGIAAGSRDFVKRVKEELGLLRKNRRVEQDRLGFILKEEAAEYETSFSG